MADDGNWRSRGARGRGVHPRGRGGQRSSYQRSRTPPSGSNRADDSTSRRQHSPNRPQTDRDRRATTTSNELPVDDSPVRGECMAMCSIEEVRMRQQTNEISRFERFGDPTTDAKTSWAVKKYRRPAAGRVEINPAELRPPHVLQQTLRHLFGSVLPWESCGFDFDGGECRSVHDFLALYHFISDRVRSVRQDFVIQRINNVTRLTALVQIARFHILASHRATAVLRGVDARTVDWSETLNDQQLASALTEVHALCRELDDKECGEFGEEAIGYDILLNLQDAHAVSLLLLKLPPHRLKSPAVRVVLRLFVAYQTRDFYTFTTTYKLLPTLHKCLVTRHLPSQWLTVMSMMNKAYGKIDRFTMAEIASSTGLPSIETAQTLCSALGLHLEEEEVVNSATTADSWEDNTAHAVSSSHTTTHVRFKVATMESTIPSPIEQHLIVDHTQWLFRQHIKPHVTATELVIGPHNST